MTKFGAAALLMCTLAVVSPAEDQAQSASALGLLRPEADFVFGIEWRRIMRSPIGVNISAELDKVQMPPIAGLSSLKETLLESVDSVVITAPAKGLGEDGMDAAALLVVKGRFDIAQLRRLIQGSSQASEKYRSVELLIPADARPATTRIVLLDSSTILAGDRAEVQSAIDRFQLSAPTVPKGGPLERAARMKSRNDVWMMVDLPPGVLKDAPPQAAQLLSGVRNMDMGVSFSQGMGVQMNVHTKNEETAKSLATTLQGLLATATLSQKETPEAAAMIGKIQIAVDRSAVRLTLALDQADLDRAIQMRNPLKQAAIVTKAPEPEPTGPKVIRITGLDGSVEVPYGR